MVIDQLDLIKNQTEAVLRNKVAGGAVRLRSETSLVKQASRLTGRMNRELEKAEKTIIKTRKTGSHRVEPQTVTGASRPVKPAPDGYVRRSAVQAIRVPEDYRKKLVRRIVRSVLLVACLLTAVWLLLQSGLLTY